MCAMDGRRMRASVATLMTLLLAALAPASTSAQPPWAQPGRLYNPVPYGRLPNYFPQAHRFMPGAKNPLYYDPRDPYGGVPIPETFNMTDPYKGAGYLPHEIMGRHDALRPNFGFVPVNYVPPNHTPLGLGGPAIPAGPPTQPGHYAGLNGLLPLQVPFPVGGLVHPLYASWYFPGIATRRADRDRTLVNGALADHPFPNARYRVTRPFVMDNFVTDPYHTAPSSPPPPPDTPPNPQ